MTKIFSTFLDILVVLINYFRDTSPGAVISRVAIYIIVGILLLDQINKFGTGSITNINADASESIRLSTPGSNAGSSPSVTPTQIPTSTPMPTATPLPTKTRTSTLTFTPTPTVDLIGPTVNITFPLNSRTVTKNRVTTIQASATDPSWVSKVEFYVDNVLKCTSTVANYFCQWPVPNRKATYTLKATAYDTRNNSSSATIKVTAK